MSKRKGRKDHVTTKENVVQTTPPRVKDRDNKLPLSFFDNPDLTSITRPKTPSPVQKTKVLEAVGQLLSEAERELLSVEAKLSSECLLSAKTSSNHLEIPSARRIMIGIPSSPSRGSAYINPSSTSRSKINFSVPLNSPSSFVHGNEENYKRNNGEQKSLNLKLCPHHKDAKTIGIENQSEKNKSTKQLQLQVEHRELYETPAIKEFSMFYEQQQLVERKTQTFKEKNSATVIFKSDAKTIPSADVVKNVQTITSPVSSISQSNSLKCMPNSSIINMKTSKPEEEEQPVGKVLNVQKMPSVNIRPGFTIQKGPKINIVGSSSTVSKPKRKNTEFFDVVYPLNSTVCSDTSFVSDQGRLNHAEYICERHTFPGGRLIPGTLGENLRQNHLQNNLNLEEKKEMLIDMIKSVTEKVEQQFNGGKKNCCRLICSLPLLASVIRKIQVDCGKCVNLLNSHLDRLVALMKEELRGFKELSDNHCCQLDEAIHYQIVELELMQEENLKGKALGNLTVMKHKDIDNFKPPKKTVSFESIPYEIAQPKVADTNKPAAVISKKFIKNIVPENPGKAKKTSSGPQLSNTIKRTKKGFEHNPTKKVVIAAHKKPLYNTVKTRNTAKHVYPILKKTTNFSTDDKEKTIISQVLKNLSGTSSLKQDTVPSTRGSGDIIQNRKTLNAMVEVVDNKELASEFEEWIEKRSLKIKQIHEELNKMVVGSMEKHMESHAPRSEDGGSNRGLILLSNLENEKESKDTNEKRAESQELNSDVSKLQNSSFQEAAQEYDDDFEDYVEELHSELRNVNSLDSSMQHIRDSAENDFFSPSRNEAVIIDEENSVESAAVITHEVTIDASSVSRVGTKSLDVKVSEVKEMPVTVSSDSSDRIENECTVKPETVSTATSPINFKSWSQSVDASVNTTLVEARRATVATSPINVGEQSIQFKSTMVQTESLSLRNIENIVPKINNKELELSVPPMRLNPKPFENIFKITLGEGSENSLALHTESTNQTLKVVVQLPLLEKVNENNKIIELESLNESERKKNCDKNPDHTNSKIDGRKFLNSPNQAKLTEQVIQDIIEPTVSQVLKKINKDDSFKNTSNHEGLNKPSTSHSDLIKPNLILQTKYGLWKRCDESPVLNIVDLEQPTPKVDSSNQTEAEKQNVCVQVTGSVMGSDCERAISAGVSEGLSGHSEGYLEMLLPRSHSTCSVPSSPSHTSTGRSSSTSTTAFTFSNRNHEDVNHMDKLSEGELLPESCNCKVGEVCGVCIPRLDLSFGEIKKKRKGNGAKSDTSSGHYRHTSVSLSNVPLHLEPKPPSARLPISLSSQPPSTSVADSIPQSVEPKNKLEPDVMTERKLNSVQFSELAKSVLSDLGLELQSFRDANLTSNDTPNPTLPLSMMRYPSAIDNSSSESSKSSKSRRGSSKNFTKQRSRTKGSLIIKTPFETPRIHAVIEDPQVSSSSYQTSVTSVSIDLLPEDLSSPDTS